MDCEVIVCCSPRGAKFGRLWLGWCHAVVSCIELRSLTLVLWHCWLVGIGN